MSNYFSDLGAGTDSLGIPLPIKSPGTVVVAQMQGQANRLVTTYQPRMAELPLVIDGIVGPKTVAALQRMAATEIQAGTDGAVVLGPWTQSTSSIVAAAAQIRDTLSMIASEQGQAPAIFAPFVVPPGQPVPPVNAPPGTPGLPPPGFSATTLMIGAVAIGVAWALLGKHGRKAKR